MSPAADEHGREHSEFLCLYALQALPASELAEMEARLAGCAECRQELETLPPIVNSFVSWPTDVLRPSASLWDRLAERVTGEAREASTLPAPPRRAEPEWMTVAPGISCRLLATDTESQRVSMLVRLAPGTDYPPHRHQGVEEVHLLHGELRVDDKTLHAGDYLRSEPGSEDHRVWSETGCTCVLMTSTRDVIL